MWFLNIILLNLIKNILSVKKYKDNSIVNIKQTI